MDFKLHSQFRPTGDQPQAIEALTRGLNMGLSDQVLLGVTGSGKTFTMANIIAAAASSSPAARRSRSPPARRASRGSISKKC